MSGGPAVRAAGVLLYRRVATEVQYLLMQASYGSHHWSPPKGHVDPGEDDMQTALRETHEEAGLTEQKHYVLDADFRRELQYTVKHKPKVVVYWLGELRQEYSSEECDPVQMSDEHQDYRWLPLDQATQLAGYKDMTGLLQECEQYLAGK